MRSLTLLTILLVVFAFLSSEAQIALEIALAVAFTLFIFTSVVFDLSEMEESRGRSGQEFRNIGQGVDASKISDTAEEIVVQAEAKHD